jgi:hypothetical protein
MPINPLEQLVKSQLPFRKQNKKQLVRSHRMSKIKKCLNTCCLLTDVTNSTSPTPNEANLALSQGRCYMSVSSDGSNTPLIHLIKHTSNKVVWWSLHERGKQTVTILQLLSTMHCVLQRFINRWPHNGRRSTRLLISNVVHNVHTRISQNSHWQEQL